MKLRRSWYSSSPRGVRQAPCCLVTFKRIFNEQCTARGATSPVLEADLAWHCACLLLTGLHQVLLAHLPASFLYSGAEVQARERA